MASEPIIYPGDSVRYKRFIQMDPNSPVTRICEVVGWSTVVEDCIVLTWDEGELLTVDYRCVDLIEKASAEVNRIFREMVR